jgi:ketosteroid isomerase-like protein
VDLEARQQLVRDAFASWNSGELDIERYAHRDCIVHSALTGETHRGRAGLDRWMREIEEQFDRWVLRVDELRDLRPDGLIAVGLISMRGRASGVELQQPFVWLFRFRDDLISEMTIYTDVDEGLAAAEEAARL